MAALPEILADQPRRPVQPADAPAAAWGDPAIVVHCGVEPEHRPVAEDFCETSGDVEWFTPPEQIRDEDGDATLTAISHSPPVVVELPGDYRPGGAGAVISQLTEPISASLTPTGETCL